MNKINPNINIIIPLTAKRRAIVVLQNVEVALAKSKPPLIKPESPKKIKSNFETVALSPLDFA